MNKQPSYTLTKIRTFNGREGQGLNAVICRDGKPVAFVLDDANGGPMEIDFTNPGQNGKSWEQHRDTADAEQKAAFEFAKAWFKTSPEAEESRRFEAELRAKYPNPDVPEKEDAGLSCLESWVNTVVDTMHVEKQFDRAAKKNLLYTRSDKPGIWQIKAEPAQHPEIIDKLVVRQPTITYTFLNTLPRAEALRLFRGQA